MPPYPSLPPRRVPARCASSRSASIAGENFRPRFFRSFSRFPPSPPHLSYRYIHSVDNLYIYYCFMRDTRRRDGTRRAPDARGGARVTCPRGDARHASRPTRARRVSRRRCPIRASPGAGGWRRGQASSAFAGPDVTSRRLQSTLRKFSGWFRNQFTAQGEEEEDDGIPT